jgi:tRNA (guanine-N7-)-methyltransferase
MRDGLGRLYGRRQGRPLRVGKRHLIDELLPTLSVNLTDDAAPASLDPRTLFASPPADIWLEIGFGGGEHIAAQAGSHPDHGLIGAEPFINGVASLLKHIDRGKLVNIRILMDDARLLLAALTPASIGRCFILFPDPWPKRRHWKRRIVCATVLDQLARIMKPGAELRLASDDPGYGQWMLATVLAHRDFEWTARGPADWQTRPSDQPQTRYEAKALAGDKPLFLTALRRG